MIPDPLQVLAGFILAPIIAVLSSRAGFLTRDGAVAQAMLAFVLLGLGGTGWTVPILVFFLLSSLLSKLPSPAPRSANEQSDQEGPRNARQVLANGGIAGVAVLLWLAYPDPALYGAYLGSVAAATADTWGTEIGMRSGQSPRMITTLRHAHPGRSGAVSLPGLVAGVLGAGIIGLSGIPWASPVWSAAIVPAVAGGMAGSLADSLAGALLQARFRCPSCGEIIEMGGHCGVSARFEAGVPWLDNDAVNLVCTAVGGLLGFMIWPDGAAIRIHP